MTTAERDPEFFRDLLDSVVQLSPDLIYFKNADHELVYVGQTYADLFGTSREALVGKTARDLWPEAEAESVLADERRVLDGDPVIDRERQVTHPDGTEHWYSIHKLPRYDQGRVVGFVAIDREITARKRREREWRRMKRAVDSSGHAIYITDPAATIEYVNPAFEQITGFSAEFAVGSTPRILRSGEMETAYYERMWETILDGEVWEETVVNKRQSGEQYHAHQTIAPISTDGEIEAFVAIQTDITDRVQLEERLSVLNRILRHDIRSAVSVIRGNADLAMEASRKSDTALETIRSEAERLHRLGENARYVERVLSDRHRPTETVQLQELVPARAMRCRQEFPHSSISYDVPDTAVVSASSDIREALSELCSNAILHSDHEDPTVEITVEEGENWVAIRVADDGPGIPADEVAPLERGGESALEHTSGLGLWVVYWIVQESGGHLAFAENDPRGTVVTLRLPAADGSD
ncbi:signal transduction histidine kinase [Halodesulfurarchaeum formicicum]|uniref:Signal transduction histidine kinase n=1 Tax=Halodesulfurarchaeum formicicum TaxID=1873524 RepID=A0A1D8S491_9EURY|nr:PAS domain S-box protein [Halodesulfurarchaeum formicicum]AOW80171.1 signal transduction histidine kinase [Halodesulfurarchaeum formicicum]